MGQLQNGIIGVVVLLGIIVGGGLFFNDQYQATGSSASLNTAIFNASGTNAYFQQWSNSTATLVANSQAVPFLGNGLVLIAGVFQVITLFINIPQAVFIPLASTILGPSVFGVPSWFVVLCLICIVVIVVIAAVNAMKGSKAV